MRRMIRWSYVIPRLGAVIAILVSMAVLAPRIAKWTTVRVAQAAIGAKVDLGDFRLSLVSGRLDIVDAEFADPRKPLQNLVEFDRAVLKVDTTALTHKRLIIESGVIEGIRFGGSRSSSGALPDLPEKVVDKQNRERAKKWLEQLAVLLGDQVVDELESVRTTRDLARQWPREYQAWEQRSEVFGQRIEKLKQLIHLTRNNPLRHLVELQQIAVETGNMAKEIELAKRDISKLNSRLRSDKLRVTDAVRRDRAQVDQALQLASLDARAISHHFLGDEYAHYVMEAVRWAAWSKTYIDMIGNPPEPTRRRGQNILFQGLQTQPKFVVKRLGLTGISQIQGAPLQFTGTLTDLTSSPQHHDRPTILKMNIDEQNHPTELQFICDRRTDNPIQELTVSSTMPQQGRSLGDRDSLALRYSAGASETWLQVRFENGEMDGKWTIKQEKIQLQPLVAEKLGGERLAGPLTEGLSEINQLYVSIAFSGPISKPKIDFQSDLGQQLAVGLNRAVQNELSRQRERLLQKARSVVADELSQLEEMVNRRQHQLLERYTAQTSLLRDLAGFSTSYQVKSAKFIEDEARQQLQKFGIRGLRR